MTADARSGEQRSGEQSRSLGLSKGALRVAVLGSGPRGLVNAELLASTGIGSVVGFWDRTPARADEAAACFGAVSDASATELVARTQPDVVAILTHPSARSELVAAAVAGGAHTILIEKPLALTAEELGRVEDAAGDAFVVVNTQYQWMPHWQEYLARIRAGELGDIHSIAGSCGVSIMEQGPHVLGLCLALASAAGLPAPEWVLAGGSGEVVVDGIDIPADIVATFGLGDVRLTFAAGRAAAPVPGESVIHFQQQQSVVGSRGRLWVSLNQGSEFVVDGVTEGAVSAGTEQPELLPHGRHSQTTEWPRDDTAAQAAFYRDLAAAIAHPPLRDTFPTRLEVAAQETRMLFAAIESARTGTLVPLEPMAPLAPLAPLA